MADVLMKGIDISTYQKNVDFNKLKKSGYDFVIIRAGVGRYASQKDDEFEKVLKPQDFMLVVIGILMPLQMILAHCLFRIWRKRKQKHSKK